MKPILTIIIATFALCTTCRAESVQNTLAIEILEFDCTKHPDLFDKYESQTKPQKTIEFQENPPRSVALEQNFITENKSGILDEIEKAAVKKTIFTHSEKFLPGDQIAQSTQLERSTFSLKASTKLADNNSIDLDLDFSLAIGDNYKKYGMETRVTMQRGKYILLGGTASVKTYYKKGEEPSVVRTVMVTKIKID